MFKKFIYPQLILLTGLVMLSGCSSYNRGFMSLESHNYESAIDSFQQELKKNPHNWRARQGLAVAYIKTGENNKAIAELQYVLGQEPADVTALSYAPRDVDWKLGQEPDAPYANYYLGLAYLRNGQRSEAVETWRSYKNPREPLLEEEIGRQLTVVDIYDSLYLAKLALEKEKKLEASPPEPGTVAVFYFKDVSPDNSFRPLQKAMAEMIITDLAQIESLTVLERLRVQYLLAEMQLGQTGIVETETAPRAGRLLGAEKLIVGSLEPGSLAVKASVASTTEEDVVGAFSVTAEVEEFFLLEKEIVYNAVKILGVALTPEEEKRISKYHTQNLQAAIYLGQGLDALDAGKWREAKIFFKRAVDEDPEFKLARYYYEHCPAATVASISSLSEMTVEQLALDIEQSMDQAIAEQTAIAIDNNIGEAPIAPSRGGEPPGNTGSVSISW